MKILRFLAWTFVALALGLIGADLVSSLEEGEPVVRTTREVLNLLPGVGIPPQAVTGDAGFAGIILDLPLWVIVGIVGIVTTILIKPVD